jgi:hypothetical protein
LSIAPVEAERLLDGMVRSEDAELQVDDEGRLSYCFRSRQ